MKAALGLGAGHEVWLPPDQDTLWSHLWSSSLADADIVLSVWTLDGQLSPPEQVKSTEGPLFSISGVTGSVWNFPLVALEKWR